MQFYSRIIPPNFQKFFIEYACFNDDLVHTWRTIVRLRVLGAEPTALKNFAFFCKNNLIYGYFNQKIMLLTRDLEIGSASMIKLVA